jgi:hypothetical protein
MSATRFKAGDVVKHEHTQETWVVAYADEHTLMPCGWPPTQVRPESCELVRACSAEESIALLKKMAAGRHDDSRASRAEAELIRLRVPEYVERQRIRLESAIRAAEQQITGWTAELATLEDPANV